jgi:hypothetical protein
MSLSDLASATVAPEDVKNTATYRGLKAVVILLGALIVVAFGLLVVGMLTRFHAKGSEHTATAENTVALPAGAEILSSDVQGDRLIVRAKTAGRDEIYIIDTGNGHLVGRVQTGRALRAQ